MYSNINKLYSIRSRLIICFLAGIYPHRKKLLRFCNFGGGTPPAHEPTFFSPSSEANVEILKIAPFLNLNLGNGLGFAVGAAVRGLGFGVIKKRRL